MRYPASTIACFLKKPRPSQEHDLAFSLWTIESRFFANLDTALSRRWHAAGGLRGSSQPSDLPIVTEDILAPCLASLDRLQERGGSDEMDALRRSHFAMRITMNVIEGISSKSKNDSLLMHFSGAKVYDFFLWTQKRLYEEDYDDAPLFTNCFEIWLEESDVGSAWASKLAREEGAEYPRLREAGEALTLSVVMLNAGVYWRSLMQVLWEVNPLSQPLIEYLLRGSNGRHGASRSVAPELHRKRGKFGALVAERGLRTLFSNQRDTAPSTSLLTSYSVPKDSERKRCPYSSHNVEQCPPPPGCIQTHGLTTLEAARLQSMPLDTTQLAPCFSTPHRAPCVDTARGSPAKVGSEKKAKMCSSANITSHRSPNFHRADLSSWQSIRYVRTRDLVAEERYWASHGDFGRRKIVGGKAVLHLSPAGV
ncbi:hypothetical protein AC578_4351 [Pseudocercospora eumusae]|uniref:Uncharacterized protein n=1 Tax=Pseudocercospora eumusae TaxID=321146 RepID=A0A139H5M8_9PEZI|nr:hypothetical protein AC578_4351 [Pseudocercospora eumusae]